MVCPLCESRKAKRACPALGRHICAVCCGTKRRTEIACPPDCSYLAGAETHPPAAIKRQRQRDFDFAMPMVHKLGEGAYRLLLAFQGVVQRYRPTALPPLRDVDVADACAALAATLETAGRGIIYEHQAPSIPAQRLAAEFRALLQSLGNPSSARERDAAAALRRIEVAARQARQSLEPTDTAYVDFLDRLPREALAPPAGRPQETDTGAAEPPVPPSGLILP